MTKWEYATLIIQTRNDQGWRYELSFFGADGKEQKLDSSNTVVVLNQLGAAGWELVSVSIAEAGLFSGTEIHQHAQAVKRQFWLKRHVS
jgi:hypothetical protein